MPASAHVRVEIDLGRIRANAERIAMATRVPVLAVVKADAYGHGIGRVVDALGPVVAGFCVFSLDEAIEGKIFDRTGRKSLAIGPAEVSRESEYIAQGVRPAVISVEQASALKQAKPVLCVDTGMQRFTCPPEQIDAVLKAEEIREAYTHATRIEQVDLLVERAGRRGLMLHAAGSALVGDSRAWLDAVRPGLAIYHGATTVTTNLVEAHDSRGPAGYTGFSVPRHGVILAGYSHGLRLGPCLVHGVRRWVIEVGMQTSFVEIGQGDRVGDPVTLLGNELVESEIGKAWGVSPQEALYRVCNSGVRHWR